MAQAILLKDVDSLGQAGEAIAEARGLRMDRKKIRLDDPIREVGTYMVEIDVGGGATTRIKTIVAEQR